MESDSSGTNCACQTVCLGVWPVSASPPLCCPGTADSDAPAVPQAASRTAQSRRHATVKVFFIIAFSFVRLIAFCLPAHHSTQNITEPSQKTSMIYRICGLTGIFPRGALPEPPNHVLDGARSFYDAFVIRFRPEEIARSGQTSTQRWQPTHFFPSRIGRLSSLSRMA